MNCGKRHEYAHASLGDVLSTAEVLDGQIARYSDLPRSIDELHQQCASVDLFDPFRHEGVKVIFTFGQHHGRWLTEVAKTDTGYLRWTLDQNLAGDVVRLVRTALDSR